MSFQCQKLTFTGEITDINAKQRENGISITMMSKESFVQRELIG